MRVLRAIELCTLTGNTIDALRTGIPKDRPFRTLKIGLELPRNELYARIHARADAMMAAGLEAEAKNLFAERHRQALQTVGYKELYAYMDGQCTREEAVERIKQNTRRYAKRQLTWMRGEPDMHWFHPDATPQIEAQVREFLNRP
jgi:tRNA dimethylallyltransferase